MLWEGDIAQNTGSWRKVEIIAIVTEGNSGLNNLADHIVEVPETEESLSPLINTIPLQLLSCHIAVMRGCSADQPRNLAKGSNGGVIPSCSYLNSKCRSLV